MTYDPTPPATHRPEPAGRRDSPLRIAQRQPGGVPAVGGGTRMSGIIPRRDELRGRPPTKGHIWRAVHAGGQRTGCRSVRALSPRGLA